MCFFRECRSHYSVLHTNNLPELHGVMREMRKVTDEFSGRVLIGETYLPGLKDMLALHGENNDEVQLPMDTQFGFIDKLDVSAFRTKLREAETGLRGNTPLLLFENHDRPRLEQPRPGPLPARAHPRSEDRPRPRLAADTRPLCGV